MSDAAGITLRTQANTILKNDWLALMSMAGVNTDSGVGNAIPSPASRATFGETPLSRAAQKYVRDADAWCNAAARALQSGELSGPETDALGYTFDIINTRRIILRNARVTEGSPLIAGIKAGADELANRTGGLFELILTAAIAFGILYLVTHLRK